MVGPTRYSNSIKIMVPMNAKNREKLSMNIIVDRKIANMKATRNIDVPIANFN
jgi:hypothetical protein